MISFERKKQLDIEDILITALLKKPKLPYLISRDFEMFIKATIITNQIVRKFYHPKPNKPRPPNAHIATMSAKKSHVEAKLNILR